MNHFFGQNLKTIRIERKLSQAELGGHLNKGQKTIGNWETGYSEPCLDDLIRISHFFNISLDPLVKIQFIRDKPNAKAGRNRHKETDNHKDFLSPSLNSVKSALQEDPEKTDITGEKEIAWRDKYIAILESRLSETTYGIASEEMLKDLMTRILSLQKMVAGLTDTVKP